MTLTLDHNQRLNLIAMFDRIETVGRREGFAICRLQEKLELSDQEREAVGYRKIKTPEGHEALQWNANGLEARSYDLSEDDLTRICNVLDKYPVMLGRDKHWWLPLAVQLPEPAETNGDKL